METNRFCTQEPLFIFLNILRLEMAQDPSQPTEHGVIKHFCRVKGHGFIKRDNGEDIFVHISE